MTSRTTLKAIAITLAAISTTLAPAAFAAPADTVSVEIDTRYLETEWGVEKIYSTLSNKAESACSVSGTRGISNRKIERDCMTDLLEDFIRSADHEKLTTYHAIVTS